MFSTRCRAFIAKSDVAGTSFEMLRCGKHRAGGCNTREVLLKKFVQEKNLREKACQTCKFLVQVDSCKFLEGKMHCGMQQEGAANAVRLCLRHVTNYIFVFVLQSSRYDSNYTTTRHDKTR